MKRKVWDITVKDNPNRVVMGENDEFYTRDTEAYLVFKLDDKHFNPATAVLTLENLNDGSLKNETVDVVDGLIEWEMPQRYIEHFGNWQGQLVYYDPKEGVPEDAPEENKFETYTSATFTFVVNAHIGDKKKPSLVEIENWEKFIREGTELIETWEDLEALREENERQRQENYQELLDTGVLQTNINEKLEELEEEYAPKLTEVTAQLAQTKSQKVDKNGSQQVTWSNIAQDAREQISGNKVAIVGKDSVGRENLTDKAVTVNKTEFLTPIETSGEKIYETIDIAPYRNPENDGKMWTNGTIVETTNTVPFTALDPIPVQTGMSYNLFFRSASFFSQSGDFISSIETGSTTFTVPEGASTVAFTVYIDGFDELVLARVSPQSNEIIFTAPNLVNFKGNSLMEPIEGDDIKEKSLPPSKLTFVKETNEVKRFILETIELSSLFNSENDKKMWIQAELVQSELTQGLTALDPIPVVAGEKYHIKSRTRSVEFWDENNKYVSTPSPNGVSELELTIPEGVTQMAITAYNTIPLETVEKVADRKVFEFTEEIKIKGGSGEAYDQSLNTSDSVEFASISTDTLEVKGEIPVGTLADPPTDMRSGDMWADTTDSETHPIVRVML